MNNVRNKAVRSLLYFLIAGGLLFLSAAFIRWFANQAICPQFNLSSISLFESIGIVALLGVILFAVKFGFFNNIDLSIEAIQNYAEEQKEEMMERKQSKAQEKIKNMSHSQRQELKDAISKYLGFDDHMHRASDQRNFRPIPNESSVSSKFPKKL